MKGVRYFDCPSLHGAMVRPDKAKVCMQPSSSHAFIFAALHVMLISIKLIHVEV